MLRRLKWGSLFLLIILCLVMVSCGKSNSGNRTDFDQLQPNAKPEQTATETESEPESKSEQNLTTDQHAWGEWVVVQEATCENKGYMVRTCSDCGETQQMDIDILGHSFGEWEVATDSTCTAEGQKKRTCFACNAEEIEMIAAKGHTFGEAVQTVAPNCTDKGESKKTCTACGHEEIEAIPANGHTYVDDICSVCKAVVAERAVQTVKIANTSHLLPLDTEVKIEVQIYPTDALYTSVVYTIDERYNTCGATITEDGVLSCTKLGSVRVRVTVDNVSSAYVTFNVPTEIKTAEDFDAIRNNLKGHYVLCNDIDLSAYSTWTPIGYATKATDGSLSYSGTGFQGEFNGNGYTISGVNIDLAETKLVTVGLFGFVDTSAIVSDVKVKANVTGTASASEYIGMLTGVNYGVVDNCEVVGTIHISGALYVGGIVGQNNGNLTNCEAGALIKASNDNSKGYYVGGIAGQFVIGSLENNTARASIEISSCRFCYVGGITGEAYGSFGGTNCDATIVVSATSSGSSDISYIGGVVGNAKRDGSEIAFDLNNKTVTGSITVKKASKLYVGGIVGRGDVLSNCIGDMDITVTSSGNTYAGGIAGDVTKISVGKNNGVVSVNSSATVYVGGVAGNAGTLSDVTNDPDVSVTAGTVYLGGVAGQATKISNGKNNGDVSVKADSNGYVGGIVGDCGSVSNGKNYGAVSVNAGSTAYVGGVAGRTTSTLSDATNYFDVSVTAATAYLGGVAGEAASAQNVYNYCYGLSISASNSATVGGVIGQCTSKIENSYNTANLKVAKSESSLYLGGIVGCADTSGNVVKNATNSGKIVVDVPKLGTVYLGGVAGNAATLSGCVNSATEISVTTKALSSKTNHMRVGGLCAYSSAKIENSYSYATIKLEGPTSSTLKEYSVTVGGLAGTAKNVSGSFATGDVSVTLYNGVVNAGGLVGTLTGTASHSYARGSVTGVTTDEIKIGGMVASAQSGASIQNCYAAYNHLITNITSNGKKAYIGGLVAHNLGTVTDSYAMNYINTIGSGSDDTIYAGGVIGYNGGTVSKSYSSSATEHVLDTSIAVDIDCTSNLSANVFVGGFVGYNTQTITDCYAAAEVIGRGCYTGGFVGYQDGGKISYALALAPVNSGVSGQTRTGGFSGNGAGSYTRCIFSTTGTQISADNGAGGTTVSGIVGKSETELLDASVLSGFDTSIWTIKNGSIPTLSLNSNWEVYNDGYDNFNVLKNVVKPDRQYVKVSNYMVEIQFESDLEVSLPELVVVEKGAKISAPVSLNVKGHGFFGWYFDAACTTPFEVDGTYTANENITLYAYFRETIVAPESKTYSYSGENITLSTLDYTGKYYTVDGVYEATDAGEYTVTLTLNEAYCWNDGTATPKTITWTVERQKVAVPASQTYTYNGTRFTLTTLDTSEKYYTVSGTTKATDAGEYTVTLTLNKNCCWSDGSTEPKTIKWTVERQKVTVPDSQTYTYNGTQFSLTTLDTTGTYYTVEGTTKATDAGEYTVTLTLNKNCSWKDGTTDVKTVTWTIKQQKAVVPTSQTYTYNGTQVSLTTLDTTEKYYTVSGTTEATDVGEYTVTLTLNKNSCWKDGTTDVKTVTWTIEKLRIAIPASQTYTYDGSTQFSLTTLDTTGTYYTVSGTTEATDAGVYALTLTLNENCCWDDESAEPLNVVWAIADRSWYNTEDTQFTLSTAAQLIGFSQLVNGGYYFGDKTITLNNSIDLENFEWTPIGKTDYYSFIGVFDGNGYAISNFRITGAVQYAGLFGVVSGTVQDLAVEDFTIDTRSPYNYAGGLVGYNYYGNIVGCYATGDVSASSDYDTHAGGLVGHNEGAITNCYATGDVSASSYEYIYVGGLVGYGYGCVITNCYATGDVSASSYRYSYAGGLVGYGFYSEMTNCYATGDVGAVTTNTSSYTYSYAGGLVGYSNGDNITNCCATGDVSASSYRYSYAGGLVGYGDDSEMTNCYATGDVSASSSTSSSYVYVGGLLGYSGGNTITNCYRYSGQIVTAIGSGTTASKVPNTDGTAKDLDVLQSVEFHSSTLGWSADDWNFVEGEHPTLKDADALS